MGKSLLEFVDKYRLAIILALVGLIFITAGIVFSRLDLNKGEPVFQTKNEAEVRIDVAGAVKTPGIYTLKADSRLDDALKAAGGLADDADKDWVAKNINLAEKIIDGGKLYIPRIGESSAGQSAGKINVNLASATELDSLPGIGKVTAEKIIEARPFKSVEDLKTKKVVSSSTFEKIKDLVSVY